MTEHVRTKVYMGQCSSIYCREQPDEIRRNENENRLEDDKDNGIVCRAAKVYRAAWCKPADECSIVDGDDTMNMELLLAAQKVLERYHKGLGIEDAAYALAKIVRQLEDEMEMTV